jgi:hypothetical protein
MARLERFVITEFDCIKLTIEGLPIYHFVDRKLVLDNCSIEETTHGKGSGSRFIFLTVQFKFALLLHSTAIFFN